MAKGVRISIDVNELHRLARDLNGTGKRLKQGQEKFMRDKVTGLLEQSTKEAFELEADPETGKRWEEWTERYRQHVMKLTNGRGHPILDASGDLATNNIVTSDQTSAEIANNLPYALERYS
ncbi:MAG: phage virion morphogenesis protein [bacterium]|nr:phage virion morphogenesis protein [bacterium]